MIIIPLTRNKSAVIDDCDKELVCPTLRTGNPRRWSSVKSTYKGKTRWYAVAKIKNGDGEHKTTPLHRLIMGSPKGKTIDHIDGNGLNCTRNNLRIATYSQNLMNQRIRRDNKTGFRGVCFVPDKNRSNPYKASLMVDNKWVFIKYFKTAVEAAIAYNEASLKHHGEFGLRNLIP